MDLLRPFPVFLNSKKGEYKNGNKANSGWMQIRIIFLPYLMHAALQVTSFLSRRFHFFTFGYVLNIDCYFTKADL